jgi:glycosyltransferase involved in cell wall biosynthesis
MQKAPALRVALVHDWLYTYGGAERVLRSMLRCLPNAEVFTLFDVLPVADRARIGYESSRTSFLQRMPAIARRHRLYLPLMPIAIEQLDLSRYDLVISSSYAVAKGVLTGPDQLHLAYVHSPMRYAWDLQHEYLTESRLTSGIKSVLARALLHRMRLWDTRTANGVNAYMVNSHFVRRRVQKIYGRRAEVIYPPVTVGAPPPITRRPGNYFLSASRLVPYKNVRAIVEAFRLLPDQRLVVAGIGPERRALEAIAGENVEFVGFVPDAELRRLMASARAFVFAASEDFGIVTVEAQSEGAPVIALGRGGSRETVITEGSAPTGLFFDSPTADAIANAVRAFLLSQENFTPANAYSNSLRFSEENFESSFSAFVENQLESFRRDLLAGCVVQNRVKAADFPNWFSPLEGLASAQTVEHEPLVSESS